MPHRIARREIDREAEGHIALGRLLSKERSEQKRRAVDRVLASDLGLRQKIERIREIDEQDNEEGLEQVVRRASVQAARRRSARIRESIKVSPASLSFFACLFTEMKRIREFGRRTHVLATRLLPPGVLISPDLQSYFVRSLQSWAGELSPRLKAVVEHGWLHLTPLQYNLVALLKQLSDRLLGFDFVHLSYRDRRLVDRLKRIESLFLMLHYRADYLGTVQQSLRTAGSKQARDEQEIEETQTLVLRILSQEVTLPSLYNSLVGLNIVKCRRFLTLSDLMRPGLGEVVSTREFDCPPQVRQRLEAYVRDSLASIKKLHGQLHEVRRLAGYLSHDEQGALRLDNLRSLYERAGGKEERDFDSDRQNTLLLCLRLFRAFHGSYFGLLNGRVRLAGVGPAAVFARSFYEIEMARLGSVMEKLEKGPFLFSNFPLSQYLQVKEGRVGPIGTELELVQLVDEGVACLVDMGKSLAKVLSLSSVSPPGEQEQPLQPVLFQGKPFSIPHRDRTVEGEPGLSGMTVHEALRSAVSACFTVGMLFRDRFIFYYLGQERRYETELRAQMKLMSNLLDPESYRELSALYQ